MHKLPRWIRSQLRSTYIAAEAGEGEGVGAGSGLGRGDFSSATVVNTQALQSCQATHTHTDGLLPSD